MLLVVERRMVEGLGLRARVLQGIRRHGSVVSREVDSRACLAQRSRSILGYVWQYTLPVEEIVRTSREPRHGVSHVD